MPNFSLERLSFILELKDKEAELSDQEKFNLLADVWRSQTGHLSNLEAAANHIIIQEIVKLGEYVIPFILRYYRDKDGWWSVVLWKIKPEVELEFQAGKYESTRRAWLDWGKQNGYLDD